MLNVKHPLATCPELVEMLREWGVSTVNERQTPTPSYIVALQSAGVEVVDVCGPPKDNRATRKIIRLIAENHGLYIRVHLAPELKLDTENFNRTKNTTNSPKHVTHYGDRLKEPIDLGYIDGHYVLMKEVRIKNWALLNYPEVQKYWDKAIPIIKQRWLEKGFTPLQMRGPGKFLDGESSWTNNLRVLCMLREVVNNGVPAVINKKLLRDI
jgi:hypothetical protein